MRKILIDTQLLILLIVGDTDRALISRHKRTKCAFVEEDFDLLERILGSASEVLVTPNILTEASNLIAQAGSLSVADRARVMATFKRLLGCAKEEYVPSAEAGAHGAFARLGLADSASLVTGRKDVVVLTSDLDLYLEAAKVGPAYNFNHMRMGGWSESA